MAIVKAKPIPGKTQTGQSKREVYAEVAYYYPQYTLQEVAKLPARDVTLLLRTARRLQAVEMYNLVQIATAPHTKKGQGVKKLSDHYKKESQR